MFGAASAASIAPAALALPPLATRPARLARGVAPALIAATTSAADAPGSAARTSAAIPATCGAAIEVPLKGT